MERTGNIYFVSDVHLGLRVGDPKERENRFAAFLDSIDNADTAAVYLLGDIWDFWYEYRDVVPKAAARITARLVMMVEHGINLYFVPGNHDIWCYRFFEQIGIQKIAQPCFFEAGGKTFCVGHGDALGGGSKGYLLLRKVFYSKVAQALFSTLHPWFAFRIGHAWSRRSRGTHLPYTWKGEDEYLYKYCMEILKERHVDEFIFGHYHVKVSEQLPGGAHLTVLNDWMNGTTPYATFSSSLTVCE